MLVRGEGGGGRLQQLGGREQGQRFTSTPCEGAVESWRENVRNNAAWPSQNRMRGVTLCLQNDAFPAAYVPNLNALHEVRGDRQALSSPSPVTAAFTHTLKEFPKVSGRIKTPNKL